MDRMSPLDALFLHVEDGVTHMHIASCARFEGPPPPYADLVRAVEAKLPLIPRYRQRVRFVPFQLGRPVWVDDPHFRLEFHVRHTALPPPGGVDELRALMGRLMSQELDRHRPLWEAWMVEGLEDDRWAIISKVHHCMVDGVAGTDLMGVFLDREPEAVVATPVPWTSAPEPSDLRLAADALVGLATSPYEQLRALRRATRAPRAALGQVREVVAGLGSLAGGLVPGPATSISGTIGPHRRWTWTTAELADVATVRHALGGTVNDVVLAVITKGFRQLLLGRGDPVDGLAIRTLVPVSVRRPDQRGSYSNLVSAMLADLPVGIDDPVLRLRAVQDHMAQLKASHQAEAGTAVTSLAELAPPALFALAERAATRVLRTVPQHSVQTVTTNVPGPQLPLYACGRRMLDYLPFVPLASGVRVGVAILSYDGRLAFGVTGDFDTAPDIEVLAAGIEAGLTELLKLSE